MLFDSSNDRIKKRIRDANNLFDTFEKEASLREFLKLQQEFPENTEILFALAVVQNSMRQQVLAIETFKSILRINSSHQDTLSILPTVIYEYGVRLKESGDIDLARQYFLDFIGLDNGNKIDLANGYKELALIEESSGNADKAKKYIRTAMDIVSNLEESEYLSNYKDYYKEIDERINGG